MSLGHTTMHEHLNMDFFPMSAMMARNGAPPIPPDMLALRPENLAFLREGAYAASKDCVTSGDVNYTATELGYFKQTGGNAVCDASPIGGFRLVVVDLVDSPHRLRPREGAGRPASLRLWLAYRSRARQRHEVPREVIRLLAASRSLRSSCRPC